MIALKAMKNRLNTRVASPIVSQSIPRLHTNGIEDIGDVPRTATVDMMTPNAITFIAMRNTVIRLNMLGSMTPDRIFSILICSVRLPPMARHPGK